MKSFSYKVIEFILLFIVLPFSFVFGYPFQIKLSLGVLGFLYVILVLLKVEKKKVKINLDLNMKSFFKMTLFKLIIIAFFTVAFVWYTNKELLFSVMISKPLLWGFILFFYSFFSVYPQELIYRTFYFERYKDLVKNEKVFIVINAIVFSLAHVLFKNILVLCLTFLGGLLFAITYKKTNSTLLVSIEHAIYGCWLFTVGMGGMLGFPA